jgi:hypothetical protein
MLFAQYMTLIDPIVSGAPGAMPNRGFKHEPESVDT